MDVVGEGLAFALRASKAGHDVRIWFAKGTNPEKGRGFKGISIVDNWLGSAKWCELIVPTGNHNFCQKFDQLRKSGIKVFGPSCASADLEIKRGEGMSFFEAAGIDIPKYEEFKSLDDAEAHVRKTAKRYVFKTLGDCEDKSLSYVGKTAADMVARMQHWKKIGCVPKGKVILQEFIEGVEMGVSRWMGSKGFVGPYQENAEFKKLMSGNIGPNTGESGTILRNVATSKLGDAVLGPLEKALASLGHMGDVDVNCIVDDKGKAWPLEFTMRCGWPAFNLQLSVNQGDPAQWMLDACNGRDTLKTAMKICCGVVVAQPDYPYSERPQEDKTGIPIYGVTKANENYLFPQSVQCAKFPDMDGSTLVEREIWGTTDDYLLVVTGQGKTVRQATTRAYDTLREITVPDMIYRDDIGERLEDDIPKLQSHGYCTEWSYG